MIEIPTPVGTVMPDVTCRFPLELDNVAVARGMRRAVNDRVHVALVARSALIVAGLRPVEAEQRADSRSRKTAVGVFLFSDL